MAPIHLFLDATLIVSEAALALRRRSSAQAEKKDGGSLRRLWIVIVSSILAAHLLAQNDLGPRLTAAWLIAGAVIFLAGTALRWWSIIHLGRFFTVDVSVAADHRLIDTGPYRMVRHPSYTGLLLQFLGIGLALGHLLSVLCVTLPTFLILRQRIQIEERALLEKLGAPYREYCARTRRLFPPLY